MNQADNVIYKTPVKIYGWLTALFLFSVCISAVIFMSDGGSANLKNAAGYMNHFGSMLFGMFMLILSITSIITPFIYKKWFKKHWYVNVTVVTFTVLMFWLVLYSFC